MRHVYGAKSTQVRIDERVTRIAARQHGVFTRSQVAGAGATRGMIDHRIHVRRWERLTPGVFRLAGTPRSWRQVLLAAVLAWGPFVVASHRAAAALWRLAGFDREPVELTVPSGRRRADPGIVHRHELSPGDVTVIDGIPVTTPARTLIDLAAVAPPDRVEEALDDAIRRRLVTISALRRRLSVVARQGKPGIVIMRKLLDERDPSMAVPESVFERRLLRHLRRSGVPAPTTQFVIHDLDGFEARVDYAYPAAMIAIEADSYRWHFGREQWDRDRARDTRLALMGWTVLRFTWADLTRRPGWVVETVRAALDAESRRAR